MVDIEKKIFNFLPKNKKNILIAFSGGTDSSCLAYILKKNNITPLLVFCLTAFHDSFILDLAKKKAKYLKLNLKILKVNIWKERIKKNDKMRCYFCKHLIFQKIKRKYPDFYHLDGTNYSDSFEFRPGFKAVEEFNFVPIFFKNKILKEEIIDYLKNEGEEGLISYPTTCLATRIKYNIPITRGLLKKIATAENFLREKGFFLNRVRIFNDKVKIETIDKYKTLLNSEVEVQIKKIFPDFYIEFDNYKRGRFD